MKGPDNKGGLLAEINVTPLVDVMLVLLIIFMMSSTIETMQMKQKVKKEVEQKQKVQVNLPRTNAKAVNLSEEKKPVLTVTKDLKFYLDDVLVVDCKRLRRIKRKRRKKQLSQFDRCLKVLGDKLVANARLRKEKELYLMGDRSLPYGTVLKVMATVRRAGIHKFGLIAEPQKGQK